MLISVYMPTHNRGPLLCRAIDSVLAQTHDDLELLIVDDGSSDGTWDVLQNYMAKDDRVRAFRNETPKGACAARNRAIKAARGKFVTGLDDDDTFLPERLALLLKHYDSQYAFICSGYFWVTQKRSKPTMCVDKVITLDSQLDANHATNQVFVERSRMLDIGGFDEELVALQDYDCFTRLIKAYGPAFRLGQPLQNIFVEHGGPRISSQRKSRLGFARFMQKHGADMQRRQRINHSFWLKMRLQEPFSLAELLLSLTTGHLKMKLGHLYRYGLKLKSS
ncbi:GalNAc(5)-diNAcBac-PP-undecaprenol beta-1,3-glucosyltransferase [Pseudidiomarina piscicola]|uniref:GalNAc(5)-diNAcBac-PP-undecaprenol beta-1,3-glucosyltransferase n=1 Tax=Pseudidiomarina piscicola TaxID=2614830 RepID=A0A6S6WMX4_9GAMM|nr:glycosyltransferase [Pseudidiomarina piscicola]CAB0151186.1 GalNAc(5)-diNAcBac-PP-undecaprenol beta-1,3-glucosyltransferase [Pseudidiomarina piscicola]VZT40692.1 GalNAc(5)-diNAcBac-PP-undecaprenol beta-1,3-glucosyltransferase [Pseudomonas aeruginosa]